MAIVPTQLSAQGASQDGLALSHTRAFIQWSSQYGAVRGCFLASVVPIETKAWKQWSVRIVIHAMAPWG